MPYQNTLEYAKQQDLKDPLHRYKNYFLFPQHEGKEAIYFCGNSLGLQSKTVKNKIEEELEKWQQYGVEAFFHAKEPWLKYHEYLNPKLGRIVGANPDEVVVMNTLTVNLHLMMVSFYRPTQQRFKIIMEGHAFPSDQYAVESQVKAHGFDPEQAIIEVHPREGEDTLRMEDILSTIKTHGEETALVLFSGLQYYTGQWFDMKAITAAGHQVGAKVGFDLAHAVGNVPMELHNWGVDFAVWCSYKYLNSGPGGPSGIFVHEKHGNNPELHRFAGWWGYDLDRRFEMEKGFIPMKGAAGWQVSTIQIMSIAPHWASLEIFDEVGINSLRAKALKLTGYLEFLLNQLNSQGHEFKIITPQNPNDRGCQLSILTNKITGKALFDYITANGVICDWREPNVIRVAPVPLYNTFEEVWQFAQLLKSFKA